MVGIQAFPIGAKGLFSGAFAVSFREGIRICFKPSLAGFLVGDICVLVFIEMTIGSNRVCLSIIGLVLVIDMLYLV